MGLFKSKDERILHHLEKTYRKLLAQEYGHQVALGESGPGSFRAMQHLAMRHAVKQTQEKYRVWFDASHLDQAYLEMSCAEYGFNVHEVMNTKSW
jgi:hypothetical protein